MGYVTSINSDILALTVAVVWGATGLFMADIVKKVGTFNFNALRNISLMILIWVIAYFFADFSTINNNQIILLLISGFFGIFIGDVCLFYAVEHIGPRRATILFSTNAAQTIIFAWLFLNESLTLLTIFGCFLVSVGVFIAIAYGKRKSTSHRWEQDPVHLSLAITIGVLAGTFQAAGTLFARPVLEVGADPTAALTLRITCAGFGFIIAKLIRLKFKKPKPREKITKFEYSQVVIVAFIAILVCNWLILLALRDTKAGIVATYISLSPIFQLLLIRFFSKEWPAPFAWIGAAISFIGTFLIFTR